MLFPKGNGACCPGDFAMGCGSSDPPRLYPTLPAHSRGTQGWRRPYRRLSRNAAAPQRYTCCHVCVWLAFSGNTSVTGCCFCTELCPSGFKGQRSGRVECHDLCPGYTLSDWCGEQRLISSACVGRLCLWLLLLTVCASANRRCCSAALSWSKELSGRDWEMEYRRRKMLIVKMREPAPPQT